MITHDEWQKLSSIFTQYKSAYTNLRVVWNRVLATAVHSFDKTSILMDMDDTDTEKIDDQQEMNVIINDELILLRGHHDPTN